MKPFETLLRVRYCECDAQGDVFNARYADYVDVAVSEFYRQLFGGPNAMLERNLDTQVVRMLIEWRSPARFDDVLAVSVCLSKLGNTSFSLEFDIRQHLTGVEVARAEVTYVMVSADRFIKQLVPDDYREKLEAGAVDHMMNLAG
jgi:acyl-CoA thioester hydrolase